jgi:hypothetical protein
MKQIGNDAFAGCRGLTKVDISDLEAWCAIRFGNSDANPLYHATRLFMDGEEVTNLTIPESVTSLGFGVFYCCCGFETAAIPDTVTRIGKSAFAYCRGLKEVRIETGVVDIGPYAFRGCSGLTLLALPDSVTSVGEYAFEDCSGLTTLSVPGAWEGTDKLANASVPEGCSVVYRIPPEPVRSTVTLDQRGGMGEMETVEAAFGEVLPAMEPPTREGYSFGGYWSSPDGTGIQYCDGEGHPAAVWNRTRDAVVYAMWTPCKYRLTLQNLPGENGRNYWYYLTVAFGETPVLPASVATTDGFDLKVAIPSREGYVFGGYWTETDGMGTQYFSESGLAIRAWDIAGDTTLYPHWLSPGDQKTTGTPIPVAYSWLEGNAREILAAAGGDYAAAALATAANEMPVWACYLAGLSPTNVEAEFKVKSISFENGELKIEWEPDLNENGTKTNRTYRVEGKPTLTNEWTSPAPPDSHFLRVWVGMQKQ